VVYSEKFREFINRSIQDFKDNASEVWQTHSKEHKEALNEITVIDNKREYTDDLLSREEEQQ